MKKWYLLYCKRGQYLRAQEHLERQHVDCITPLIVLEKNVRGRLKMVSEPLFPNYMFIQFDPECIHTTTISATRGVSHFVRFGHHLATVHADIIEQLINSQSQLNNQSNDPLYCGDNVLITDGDFAGLQAIYSEPDGEVRSHLLLNMIHQQVKKSICNSQFKKI